MVQKVTTLKMPKETEQQYIAWLLYCETGSIEKLHRTWQGLHQGLIKPSLELEGLTEKLGKPLSKRTLLEWSRKYGWVERKDLKLAEDLEVLREKTKKIARDKKHKLAEAFERIINKKLKQLRDGERVTTIDLKQIWEMFRTELGQLLGKKEFTIREAEQAPPESDSEIDKIADEAEEKIITIHLHGKHPQTKRIRKKESSSLDT